jgi:diaminopimelate decarboxylase
MCEESKASSSPPPKLRALSLRPAMSATVRDFIAEQKQLRQLVKSLGSPLNILFPDSVSANVQSFADTLSRHRLLGRVFFAHKTSRSDSVVKKLATEKVSLDVASLAELKHALACGFDGSRLEATGPKNAEFIALCLMHSVVLNLDSKSELEQAITVRRQLKLEGKTRVLIRLSGFADAVAANLSKSSRFGVPLVEVDSVLSILEENEEFSLLGFSFHLDTTSVQERVVAIEKCLALFDEAINRGFAPQVLNIGGGFRINYLADEHDWSNYVAALKQSVLGLGLGLGLDQGSALTWQKNTFGMSVEGGVIRGNFNSYNFFEPSAGAKFLEEVLSQRIATRDDATVAEILSSNMIELWIEPGRAIVDQCGITVARVNSVRQASGGELLVSLNMKRSDLAFLDQEIFVDPVVVYKRPPSANAGSVPVFFAGNLCLEGDLIYRHATFVQKVPEPGDLVVFINTAGYSMDFSTTNSIMQPSARKVAVIAQAGSFVWVADEDYSPVWQFYDQET